MVPEDVERAFTLLVNDLTDTFSPDQLVAYISLRRNKPLGLQIVHLALPPGTSGCAIGLVDADVIATRSGIEERRYLQTIGHESAHFLLRHIPRLSAGAETARFEEFLQSRNIQHAVLRDRTSNYESPREHHAEMLGRLLLRCFRRYEQVIPDVTADVFNL